MKAKTILAVVVMLLAVAGTARANFSLSVSQELIVKSAHEWGRLYDQSKAWIVTGGVVSNYILAYSTSTVNVSGGNVGGSAGYLYAYDSSTVNVSIGSVSNGFRAYNSSTINISGGWVNYLRAFGTSTANVSDDGRVMNSLYAQESSTVNMYGGEVVNTLGAYDSGLVNVSGGVVNTLEAYDSGLVNVSGGEMGHLNTFGASTMNVSGGSAGYLNACDTSTMTFDGKDFVLGTGLLPDGDKVLGMGVLSGKWLNGTPWTVTISRNDPGATILLVPEPATLSLLALAGLAVLRRRRMA